MITPEQEIWEICRFFLEGNLQIFMEGNLQIFPRKNLEISLSEGI